MRFEDRGACDRSTARQREVAKRQMVERQDQTPRGSVGSRFNTARDRASLGAYCPAAEQISELAGLRTTSADARVADLVASSLEGHNSVAARRKSCQAPARSQFRDEATTRNPSLSSRGNSPDFGDKRAVAENEYSLQFILIASGGRITHDPPTTAVGAT